jgi:hypothetical protein
MYPSSPLATHLERRRGVLGAKPVTCTAEAPNTEIEAPLKQRRRTREVQ